MVCVGAAVRGRAPEACSPKPDAAREESPAARSVVRVLVEKRAEGEPEV